MIFGNKSFATGLVLALLFVSVSVGNAANIALSIYEEMLIDGTRTAYATWGGDPGAVIHVTRDESRTDGVVWLIDLTDSGHTVTYFPDWVYSWADIHIPDRYNNLYMTGNESFTFESEWPVATGDNSPVYSNGVSINAGLDYNGDGVFARIVKTALPVDECAAGFTNAYGLDKWVNGPISGGSTWITPDSGPAGTATFSYDVNLNDVGDGVSFRTATFKAKAFGTGTFTFDYDYSGFHAFHDAYADFELFADGPNGIEKITIVDYVKTSSSFSFTGSASIEVYHGYEFGFIIGGENYDSNSRLLGNLTISKVNSDADSDTVSDVCDVCPGSDDLADSDGDGVPDACDICLGDDNLDSDDDGVPDGCDICPGGDDDLDSDDDGVPDACDICPGGDDFADADFDGIPNACDGCSLVPGDVNCDNRVDLHDLAILSSYWLIDISVVPS